MNRKKAEILIVILAFSLTGAVIITPTKAAPPPDQFTWTSADGVSWGSDLGQEFGYATMQPMKALAYAGAGSPSGDISDADYEKSHASLLYYFTPSTLIDSVDIDVNIAELDYYYFVLAGGGAGEVYVRVSLSKVSGGDIFSETVYSDTFIAWGYGERPGYVESTTWEVSRQAALSAQQYCLTVTLDVRAMARLGTSATGGVNEYLPSVMRQAARLIVNSVSLTLTPGIKISDSGTNHVMTSGRAYSTIWITSYFSTQKFFKIWAWSSLPNPSSASFGATGYQNAYPLEQHTTGQTGYGSFVTLPGGYIFYQFSVGFSGATFGATYHIYWEIEDMDDASIALYITTDVVVDVRPGGGGGGCPDLLVWNGTGFVDEGLLSIHNLASPDSDVVLNHTLTTTPAITDHTRYTLELFENPKGYDASHSWIDQVKLYAVDTNGIWYRCTLVSAIHSRDGNVLQLLQRSDDRWAETYLGDKIVLQFRAPHLNNIAQFFFVIEGHNMK